MDWPYDGLNTGREDLKPTNGMSVSSVRKSPAIAKSTYRQAFVHLKAPAHGPALPM